MALGMIEVFGFTTALVIADAVSKAANIHITALDANKPAAGDSAEVPLVMIVKFEGNVSEVEQGMIVGVEIAKQRDLYITSHMITRQEDDTNKLAKLSSVGKDRLTKG